MARSVGLRTELIVNLAIVLGAALLLSSLLLVRLAERHWVAQRVETLANVLESAVAGWDGRQNPGPAGAGDSGQAVNPAAGWVRELSVRFGLTEWCFFSRDLDPVDCESGPASATGGRSAADRVRRSLETDLQVDYTSSFIVWDSDPDASVEVTVPVVRAGKFAGAARGVFSLAGIRKSAGEMIRLAVLIALGYGAVLIFFGAFFLNRNVVNPVRRLMESTRRVQKGDLEQSIAETGPGEVAELGRSFQDMLAALRKSREETETTILSLRKANRELQRTREVLIRSEKLASVGHLAAGVAHEIGNPLGAVIGYLELLKGRLPEGEQQEMVVRSLAETARISRLIRDLLDFAAPGEEDVEIKDPVQLLREAVQILTHQGVFKGIEVRDDMPDGTRPVAVIPHKLVQVFVNLLVNARDASPRESRIWLTAGHDQDGVWLAVADEGEGIPAEEMGNIFDPFFTTKDPGKGRGLGLSVCHRILSEAGGRIEVSSAPGRGSVFTVRLRKTAADHEEE